jgi:hypothetical protein
MGGGFHASMQILGALHYHTCTHYCRAFGIIVKS